ncbi:MAG: cytochrome c biogenesis CcdA family protein [Actinomycetota bacterium]
MIDASMGFAFAAGMVSAFNPCGFAMLPAYLSLFLGTQGGSEDRTTLGAVRRALLVGGAVSAGFVVVFGLAGVVLARASLGIVDYIPWFTVAIGSALALLGVAMVRGYEPVLRLPRLQRAPSGKGLGSMFAYGVSYATVSLTCTLPVFLAAIAGTFTRGSFVAGMSVYGAYAAGMGVVLLTLTLAVALARSSMIGRLRRVLPYVNRASGLLLAVAGAYVAYYGYWELRLGAGASVNAGPVRFVGSLSARVETFITSIGAGRIGVGLGVAMAVMIAGALLRARVKRRTPAVAEPQGEDAGEKPPISVAAGDPLDRSDIS